MNCPRRLGRTKWIPTFFIQYAQMLVVPLAYPTYQACKIWVG